MLDYELSCSDNSDSSNHTGDSRVAIALNALHRLAVLSEVSYGVRGVKVRGVAPQFLCEQINRMFSLSVPNAL